MSIAVSTRLAPETTGHGLAVYAVYPSLTRPVLWGGVPSHLVIAELVTVGEAGAIALVTGHALIQPLVLAAVLVGILHLLLAWWHRDDPQAAAVYRRALRWSAWRSAQPAVASSRSRWPWSS